MECLRHPGTPAVGVCASCGAAVCRVCLGAASLPGSRLACSDCAPGERQRAEEERLRWWEHRARAWAAETFAQTRQSGPTLQMTFAAAAFAPALVMGFAAAFEGRDVLGIGAGALLILALLVLAVAEGRINSVPLIRRYLASRRLHQGHITLEEFFEEFTEFHDEIAGFAPGMVGPPVSSGIGCGRVLVCLLFPPLAVVDRGCGVLVLVFCLSLVGWVPGVIAALVLLSHQPPHPPGR